MRSDNANFLARHSAVGLTPGLAFSTSAGATPVWETDAAAIGGKRINMGTNGALVRCLSYPARGMFTSKTISVHIRAQVLSSALIGMFDICGGSPIQPNRFALYQNSSVWKSFIADKNGVIISNSPSLATQAPTTTVYQDFVLTWDGTSSANAIKFWIDAVNAGNATATGTWANPQDANLTDFINIGSVAGGVNNVNMYVNEVNIWNTVIDPSNSSILLTSGLGNLNGTSRTAFVDSTTFGGGAYSRARIVN